MCNCHHFSLFILQLIDNLILSNYPLLHRLHSILPAILLLFILNFLKALTKWLSGGKSWLGRQCADRRSWNQRKGRVVQLIALSLRHSRSLHAEAKILFYSPQNVKIDLDRIAKIIALKKGIPLDSESFGVLKESLIHIVQLENLISHVITRARVQFSKINHMVLLESLWSNLHPSSQSQSEIPSIPDKKWQELGFQGQDPSTDFRGMGLLGLDQLLAFTQISPKSAHNLWQQSNLGSAWFTFATVGINITALLYGLLVSRSADEYFYIHSSIEDFNYAYKIVFEKFGQYWIVEEAKDVMDFSRIFGKLKFDLELTLESTGELFNE